jgi:hypothetical protein
LPIAAISISADTAMLMMMKSLPWLDPRGLSRLNKLAIIFVVPQPPRSAAHPIPSAREDAVKAARLALRGP